MSGNREIVLTVKNFRFYNMIALIIYKAQKSYKISKLKLSSQNSFK